MQCLLFLFSWCLIEIFLVNKMFSSKKLKLSLLVSPKCFLIFGKWYKFLLIFDKIQPHVSYKHLSYIKSV